MSWEFEPVAGPFEFTEGPVWDGRGVLFTDIPSGRILRYDSETGDCGVYLDGTGGANGLKLAPDGRLYGCEMGGRQVARYDADGSTTVVDRYRGKRLNGPNDLAIHDGAIWFTDSFYDVPWLGEQQLELDHRSVYWVDPDTPNTLARVTRDTTNPNGILVSPDGDQLYVAQSDYAEDAPTELRAYPIEGGTAVGDYVVLHDFHPHRGIDGMCLDVDGNIVALGGWAESGPGPTAYVFAPDGEVLERHPVPDPMPTNCAFGGTDLGTLYATGSEGYLYAVETGRAGYLGPPNG